jgi:uncharacterized Zn finger protein
MASQADIRCADCRAGYHAPFDRFERMAVVEQGPTFLMRCTVCGSLWHETLHDARLLSASEAVSIYPAVMAS